MQNIFSFKKRNADDIGFCRHFLCFILQTLTLVFCCARKVTVITAFFKVCLCQPGFSSFCAFKVTLELGSNYHAWEDFLHKKQLLISLTRINLDCLVRPEHSSSIKSFKNLIKSENSFWSCCQVRATAICQIQSFLCNLCWVHMTSMSQFVYTYYSVHSRKNNAAH